MGALSASLQETMAKLGVQERELQRWTTASDANVASVAQMQVIADEVFSKARIETAAGDAALKAALESTLGSLQTKVAAMELASTQAAIINGSGSATGYPASTTAAACDRGSVQIGSPVPPPRATLYSKRLQVCLSARLTPCRLVSF